MGGCVRESHPSWDCDKAIEDSGFPTQMSGVRVVKEALSLVQEKGWEEIELKLSGPVIIHGTSKTSCKMEINFTLVT